MISSLPSARFIQTHRDVRTVQGVALGAGAADPNVTSLQVSLAELAAAAGVSAADPGPATGFVDDRLVAALAAGIGIVADRLDHTVAAVLQLSLSIGGLTDTGERDIKQFAPYLDSLFRAEVAARSNTWGGTVTSKLITVSNDVTDFFRTDGVPGAPWSLLRIGAVLGLGGLAFFKLTEK
jgi:hypothetical protein